MLGRWLIGSTSERVLDKLETDVLILHPERSARRRRIRAR
jgi:nucleotide-binding universal stress UspA family protein